MTRKKVKLVWIVNDAARKASLKKRRIGLMKKVSELTTLCGVNAFAIIYSPDESEPMIWPSQPVVEQMLTRFQSLPELERTKKMMNQESYLKERMVKLQEHSRKNAKKNRELEMSYLMDKLHHNGNGIDAFQFTEMHSLVWLLEERMGDLRKRVDYFRQAPPFNPQGSFLEPPPPLPALPLPLPPPPQQGGGSQFRSNPNESVPWDQWFIDMMNNSDNVAGGSGSGGGGGGARNDPIMMPPLPPPLQLPHGYNLGGFHGGGDVGILGLGPPYSGGNPFDLGMPSHGNPNPNFGLGFPTHGDFPGSSSGNPMGFAPLPPLPPPPPPPPNTASGGSAGREEEMQRFFAGGSDMGLSWPPNLSP